ncbi:S8/S53 family peptidase [Conexibacter sp. SYSU D00693]|uniref:S8/S53 family peptidase n=1 Tax=Conexibacter sp. SYSU D00693 TaxID=2812560 RepID=UPI00196A778C|nr:S8/S53 family peptidase [Conexibacter sp. SYSU D00693]
MPLLALAGLAALPPTAAQAAESPAITAQAKANHFEFVRYLDPPPGPPAELCIVDTGVAITPDTPPDNPNGPIVSRTVMPGVDGNGQGAPDPLHLHGTSMAFYAAAVPDNDWGTVGMWPGARIRSVQALGTGETSFAFDTYRRGIRQCLQFENVKVVGLALSCHGQCEPKDDDLALLAEQVALAKRRGVSVVASLGNDGPGAIAGPPATLAGVYQAGAASADGWCTFSTRDLKRGVRAAGCDADSATDAGLPVSGHEGGSSSAAMLVSTALALLRAYRSDLSADAAEDVLTRSARHSLAGGPVLDVEAAFEQAGLASYIASRPSNAVDAVATDARAPSSPLLSTSTAEAVSSAPTLAAASRRARRFTRPVVRFVRWSNGQLVTGLANRPARAAVRLRMRSCSSEFSRIREIRWTKRGSTLRVSAPSRPNHVDVRYVPARGSTRRASVSQRVRVVNSRSNGTVRRDRCGT